MSITNVVIAILGMLEAILPNLVSSGSANVIDTIIKSLITLLPFIVQEISSLVQPVKNIIAALSANPATTEDQLAQLQALDANVDAAFEAAAKDTDAGI